MVPKSFHTTPPPLTSNLNVPLPQISTVYLFPKEHSYFQCQLLILTNTVKHQFLYYFYTYNDNNCKHTKIFLLGRTDLHRRRFFSQVYAKNILLKRSRDKKVQTKTENLVTPPEIEAFTFCL